MKNIFNITFLLAASYIAYSPVWGDENYQHELSKAQALIEQANTVNGLWRDTQKLVAQAQEQATLENHGQAIYLLKQAQFQAQQGYTQANNQSELKDLIPYYLQPQ